MTIIQEIDNSYNEYIQQNHTTPNVAIVNVKWNDGETSAPEMIAINGVDALDDDILFYCNSLQGLKELTSENCGEDFIVINLIGFDNIA